MSGRDENRWTLAAVGLIAVLVCVDVALGRKVQFSGSLVVAPFLAGAMVRPRPTLVVALLAVAAALFLVPFNDASGMEMATRFIVLTGGGALAVFLSARRAHQEREFEVMTRVAEVAQRCVLTSVPAQVGGLAFASRYISASPAALIGGDFYEVLECETGGGVRAVVGDVRGKGLDAVRLAAVVLGSFREAAQSLERLEDVASLVDRRLRRHLEPEDFVTAVFAEFDPDGSLRVVNCGHHPPLLVRSSGDIELLTPRSATTPLGLDPSPVAEPAAMGPGDRLLLYTDGLVEARSRSGRTIALDHLAGTLLHPNLDGALGELVNALKSLVIGALEDDLALLLVEYRGKALIQDPDETRILSITAE